MTHDSLSSLAFCAFLQTLMHAATSTLGWTWSAKRSKWSSRSTVGNRLKLSFRPPTEPKASFLLLSAGRRSSIKLCVYLAKPLQSFIHGLRAHRRTSLVWLCCSPDTATTTTSTETQTHNDKHFWWIPRSCVFPAELGTLGRGEKSISHCKDTKLEAWGHVVHVGGEKRLHDEVLTV